MEITLQYLLNKIVAVDKEFKSISPMLPVLTKIEKKANSIGKLTILKELVDDINSTQRN